MRKGLRTTTVVAPPLLAALAGAAAAQEAGWTFSVSPYAWAPGIETRVDTQVGPVEAEARIGDVLSALDLAAMGLFEARRGRLGLLLDLVYADLSESGDTPGVEFSGVRIGTELALATAYGAWRVLEQGGATVDALAGFRAASADVDVRLAPGASPALRFDLGESWVDPLLGARARVALDERWFAAALADVGGGFGDSGPTWQAVATVGYRITERVSVEGGWRHLALEREIEGRDVELDLSGPLLGVTIRF